MLAFLRFFRGYYEICLCGYSPERFMNLCRLNGIILWDIEPHDQFYLCKISVRDHKRMDAFLKKTKVKADIRKEYGLPFFMQKNKKRKIFFSGILLSLCFLYFMTFFIWSFTFSGNETISDDILFRFINSMGVDYGTYKKKIDIPLMEKEIREYFEDISWVSVKISGTGLSVSVKENTVTDRTDNDREESRDLISPVSGTIVSMITRNGVPLVKTGEEVDVGTLLVEGRIPICDDAGEVLYYDPVKADADITVRTQYPIHRNISRYYRHKNYTGKEYSIPYLRFGQNYFALYHRKNPYKLYDAVTTQNTHPILSEFSIPVYWGKKRYCEYVEIEDLYGEKEGRILLKQFLDKTIKELNEKGVQIIEKNVKIESDSQYLRLTGFLVIDIVL